MFVQNVRLINLPKLTDFNDMLCVKFSKKFDIKSLQICPAYL